MMKKIMTAGVIAATLGLGASAASAATVELKFNGIDVTPPQRVDIFSPKSFNNLKAGGFDMTNTATGESFLAWCIDLFDTIKSVATYEETRPGQVTDAEETDLNRLFTSHRTGAQATSITAAAFQLAIWEIVYETDTLNSGEKDYQIGTGTFRAGDNASVVSAAQGMLDTLGTEAKYQLSFYTSENYSQDLVTGVVPLPASLALMLGGLGMLSVARRRKS